MSTIAVLPDGRFLAVWPSALRLQVDDEWTDWGPMLPLAETVGELRRALVVVAADAAAIATLTDNTCLAAAVGEMSWHRVSYGPNVGSQAWNFGISLAAPFRGQGMGAVAQRLLAEYLFAATAFDRVEASTDVTNVAEQRSLVKAGFHREGVLRGAQFRGSARHDLVLYAVLRGEINSSG